MIEKLFKKRAYIVSGFAAAFLVSGGMLLTHEELCIKLVGYGLTVTGIVCVSYLGAEVITLKNTIECIKKNKL